MIQIPRIRFFIMCYSAALLLQCSGHEVIGRISQVYSDYLKDECKDINSVTEHENKNLQRDTYKDSLENVECKVHNSRRCRLDVNVSVQSTNYIPYVMNSVPVISVSANTAEEMRIAFEEKAREDGYKVTTPEDFPYAVLLQIRDRLQVSLGECSGTLTTTRWVVTAAHCFPQGYYDIAVYVGGNSVQELKDKTYAKGSQLQYARKIYPHPRYTPESKVGSEYDVGLVQVDEDFNLTNTVGIIELSLRAWRYEAYRKCQLTGFGKVKRTETSVQDSTRKSHYLEVNNRCKCYTLAVFRELMLCSRPREDYGVCSGDSGGGLICGGLLVAVAVAMVPFSDIDSCRPWDSDTSDVVECGVKNTLNTFQQICPYIHWISTHITSIDTARIDSRCSEPDPIDQSVFQGTAVRSSNLLTLTLSLVLIWVVPYI